jgi:hypothetical protein
MRGLAQEGRFFSREATHGNGTFKVFHVETREIRPGSSCTVTDSTRVGIRHSAAILGCVFRLSQRIEVTRIEVTWRQTKHQILGNSIIVEGVV